MVRAEVNGAVDALRPSLKTLAERQAIEEAYSFVRTHLVGVPEFANRYDLLSHSIESRPQHFDGLYLEFGVYSGETINHIASQTSAVVHGFDSFEGLPEDWRVGFGKGVFAMNNLPEVRDNVKLHKGWFDEVLPGFRERYSEPIVFVHLDADLYSSTKTVFDELGARIVPGTILQFDELWGYPGWREGEFRAFQELVEERRIEFEYIGYSVGFPSEQAAVRILSVGADDRPPLDLAPVKGADDASDQ